MNIVQNENGKVTIVYNRDEISPVGGSYGPEVFNAIADKYGFVRRPDPLAGRDDGRFERGRLVTSDQKIVIYELVVYNDGISIIAGDTDLAHVVLNDVLQFGISTFGLRTPITEPYYIYENRAVVDFDCRVTAAISIYDEFKNVLDKSMASTYKQDAPTNLVGFAFAVDPDDPAPRVSQREFTIVRRLGFSYSGNRFYCTAPLPTSEHHACLLAFEEALSNK